jgi:diguanylate cyclase (GGDEF)-like protein
MPPSGSQLDSPVVVNLQSVRRMAGWSYAATAGMLVVRELVSDPDPRDHTQVLVLSAVALVIGLVLLAGRRKLTDGLIKFVSTSGALIIIGALVAVMLPIGAALLCYAWPALAIGYLCTRREMIATLVVLTLSAAVGLALSRSPEITATTWLATAIISSMVTVGVWNLARRVNDLIGQLSHMATTDELTGLLNRRAFMPILERELARAAGSGLPLSVVAFDLDHFKLVNDRFGHAAGDDALRSFGALLGREVGDVDVAARVGGEEFAVLLFDTDELSARRWAETVADQLVAESRAADVQLSTSGGVATFGPEIATAGDLLKAADRALYAAKLAGRRRIIPASVAPAQLAAVA